MAGARFCFVLVSLFAMLGVRLVLNQPISPVFDVGDFVLPRENPYFPLRPGTSYFYRAPTSEGIETNEVVVTYQKKQILGAYTTVIHDRVFLNGDLTEETFDWYAADRHGNVWYFGEDSREIEDGQVVSTHGSWMAGRNGAQPGIIMLANPQSGIRYREEFSLGVAEDMAEVVSLDNNVAVHPDWPYLSTSWPFLWSPFAPPSRAFQRCLKTRNFTPLEPGVVELKFYAPGVGLVMEVGRDEEGNLRHGRLIRVVRP